VGSGHIYTPVEAGFVDMVPIAAFISSELRHVVDGLAFGDALILINVVTLHRARLVPGWVTIFGRVNYMYLGM